jgi:mercuric ion binding protein
MAALPGTASAATIKATVNGMVCAFCVTSIEKTFKDQPGVESVAIDLETKLVTLVTKKGQDISDEEIKKIIIYDGYDLVKIERE